MGGLGTAVTTDRRKFALFLRLLFTNVCTPCLRSSISLGWGCTSDVTVMSGTPSKISDELGGLDEATIGAGVGASVTAAGGGVGVSVTKVEGGSTNRRVGAGVGGSVGANVRVGASVGASVGECVGSGVKSQPGPFGFQGDPIVPVGQTQIYPGTSHIPASSLKPPVKNVHVACGAHPIVRHKLVGWQALETGLGNLLWPLAHLHSNPS